MTRTTTPDRYSADVKHIYLDLRAKKITPLTFAMLIAMIWELRG